MGPQGRCEVYSPPRRVHDRMGRVGRYMCQKIVVRPSRIKEAGSGNPTLLNKIYNGSDVSLRPYSRRRTAAARRKERKSQGLPLQAVNSVYEVTKGVRQSAHLRVGDTILWGGGRRYLSLKAGFPRRRLSQSSGGGIVLHEDAHSGHLWASTHIWTGTSKGVLPRGFLGGQQSVGPQVWR
jgi:hypothetical protein